MHAVHALVACSDRGSHNMLFTLLVSCYTNNIQLLDEVEQNIKQLLDEVFVICGIY